MRLTRTILVVGGCAATLVGCGVSDPYQARHPTTAATATSIIAASPTSTSTTTPVPTSAGPTPGEHDGPPTPASHVGPEALSRTPQQALTRFAQLYVNWTATQLPLRARQLAGLCTEQAHTQALRLGDRARVLERYGVTNVGSVTAIGIGQGSEQGRWVVVTNELTSGSGPYLGLPATSHVTWATLTRQQAGYVLTGWYPAS